jgi:carboxypeptidase family protein
VTHLKLAAQTSPAGTPSWRTALWHLGAALEQMDQKQEALDYYIKSFNAGDPDPTRRAVIEQLYQKINGSLDGLDQKITGGGFITTATETSVATPTPTTETPVAAATTPPEAAETTPSPSPEASPVETPKPEAPKPETSSSSPISEEEAMRIAATRTRTTVRVTGRVLDANKTGIANATLVLISPTGMVLTATTDIEGRYEFMIAVPSQKTYRIIPSKDGYTFAPVDKTFAGLLEDQRAVDFIGSRQ